MPSHQSRVAKFTLLLLGLLLILPACVPFTTAGPAARLAATQSPTPANLKAADQVFTLIGSVDDPPTLDPALASDSTSAELIRHLFSGLVRLDDTLAVVPDLAAALPELSADGRTYTFRLRPGLRWPDGRAVTADDVRYSLERATDPALAAPQPGTSLPAGLYLNDIVGVPERLAGAPGPLKGVNVLAPDTIALTISTPRAYFLQKLVTFYVVDRRNVEAGDRDWYRHPQGTGPFRLQDWRSGDRITLVPNPTYYGGAPHLRQVNFLLGEAATGGLVQYEQGLIDFVGVPADDVDRVQDPAGPLHAELHVTPGLSTTYLGFNMSKPPFDDPKVREAFSLVVNRDKIARVMFNGRVEQAAGIVPTALPGYTPTVTVPALDIARARQLLAESRYHGASGLPRIAVYSNGGDIGPMLQQVFKAALGVGIEVRVQDWAEYLAGLHRGDYQAFISGWEADWPEPSTFLEALFRSTSPENETGLRDPEVDGTLDRAAATPDPAQRYALYAAAEQRALAATPLVPLFHSVNYELLRSYVHGVTITPLGILNLKDAYIDRGH
jgi:peptide/nickel transport system substrate-binding protein/oligopeptide transport system substrate-binding protein